MLAYLILILYFVSSESKVPCDTETCPSFLIRDNYCDEYCMIPKCNYDSPYYSVDKYSAFMHSDCYSECDCSQEKLMNGMCDPECNNYECAYDLGDCGYCASGCFIDDLESHECKYECFNNACSEYENNQCNKVCEIGCSIENDLYADTCKEECSVGNCIYYSKSTCNTKQCAPYCKIKQIGNGACDGACNNAECEYDRGDCECSSGCNDTSGECLTNDTYTDPCDTQACDYKNGKCGYCASGCFEDYLGDATCQPQCNTESCNFDNGDCGCFPGCTFIYNNSISNFTQTGSGNECSIECLVLECHFGIDFCTNSTLVKLAVLSFLVYKDKEKTLNMTDCLSSDCVSQDINSYLDQTDICEEGSACDSQECFYCMGKNYKDYNNCLRQSYDECLLCKSTMVEGTCYEDLGDCPNGYENIEKLTVMFGNALWCLKKPLYYSKSFYNEILVGSAASEDQNSSIKTLYTALVNVYATYTKIYIVSKEIDFLVDDSSSVLISDVFDPLNIKTYYSSYELWIIGNYSEHEKSKVFWKDNLKISPKTHKFFLKNLEFIGKYVLKNDCVAETCFYCPIVNYNNGVYTDDNFHQISESDYKQNYSVNCHEYSSVNVLNFSHQVYIENVNFAHFRYQFNSFIKSSGALSLKNVNFIKMQAKSDGSIIILECTGNCTDSSFTYDNGLVTATGAGYIDHENITSGSFFKSSNIGNILFSNVSFKFNFVFCNLKSPSKGYVFYSKNHIGNINFTDCEFYANFVNYLIYIDTSNLIYKNNIIHQGKSITYSQKHFYMNRNTINSVYCSSGLINYLMGNVPHNIEITNVMIDNSVIGEEGIFQFLNTGQVKDEHVNGYENFFWINIPGTDTISFIYYPALLINLENITVQESIIAKHTLFIDNYSNAKIKNLSISNVKDTLKFSNNQEIYDIVLLFKDNIETKHFFSHDSLTKVPILYCNEMIFVSNVVNLNLIDVSISNISCEVENVILSLSVNKITGSFNITNLFLRDMVGNSKSGIALNVVDSNVIYINKLTIFNVTNKDESVVEFDNCIQIIINSVEIKNIDCNYRSPFVVSNSGSFLLSNFLLENMTSNYGDGGCIYFIAGTKIASYKVESGIFTKCESKLGEGGAISLGNSIKKISTLLQIYEVSIVNCSSIEGSAIYISNTISFSLGSEIVGLLIEDNFCSIGGVIPDYHFFGNLKIDELYMRGNNKGIYVFFPSELIKLEIFNSKIYAHDSLSPAFYLNSMRLWSLISFKNVEIFGANYGAIQAFNLIISITQMNITDSYQGLYFNEKVVCKANSLRIMNIEQQVINLEKNTKFTCNSCEFTQNVDSIIKVGKNSNFTLENTIISSNNLKNGYLIFISSEDRIESFLINCQIFSNSLISGSLIFLLSSSLTMNDCTIQSNKGYTKGIKSIHLFNSQLTLKNSKLHLNSIADYGSFVFAEASSIVSAINSTFENGLSQMGNIYGSNVEIYIDNCLFLGNSGGDIYTSQSYLYIRNSNFENSFISTSNSGVLRIKGNYITVIEGTIFEKLSSIQNLNKIAYVYDESSEQLKILNCTFIASGDSYMSVFLKESASILIKTSSIIGFNTTDYSALTAISNVPGCQLNLTSSKINENRSGKNGGGVYSENYDLTIENTEISSNKAENSGGGVYFISNNCDKCGLYLLENTTLQNNSCKNDGGGLYWKNYKPFIDTNTIIANNSALYGSDLASIPAHFGILNTRMLSDSLLTISNVPPGKKFTDIIQVYIYDTYGQVVKTENSITATLLANDTEDSIIAISGLPTFKAQNGELSITDFILSGKPGSSGYLKLKSDNSMNSNARNDLSEYSDTIYFKINLRNCTNGEQIQATACIDCIPGRYTLKASENCVDCPSGAFCTGGEKIVVKKGYWRSSLESDIVYACEVFDACLKGTDANELGNCSTGYSGILCKSCELGYTKKANGICTKCPKKESNFANMILLSIEIIVICYVLVKAALASAFSPKSLHSIYIKIFTNYLQLVFIITQFDLEWPLYVTEFFNAQRSTSSISDQLFSFDCFIHLETSADVVNVYYTKLIIITALPIVITAISYLYWILHGSTIESYTGLKREVYTTIIVLFFLVYPTIVNIMFSNFSCIKIDKMNSYLNVNTSLECWDLNHKKYSFIVVIPSILLWVIGIPTILLILMTKNRRRLHLDYYRVVFGFLYNGYKQSRYYWEINIMYRKILLIMITVFKISQAHVLQALNLIIVLIASIYLHYIYSPYNLSELNNMEMQALNIAALTIYFGLYYLSKSIGKEIQILLFVFILLGNSYFIFYWIYYMGKAGINVFIKFFPRFRSLFKRGDAFDEEFFREEIVREGVYFDKIEGRKVYSFANLKTNTEIMEFKYRNMDDVFKDIALRDIKKMDK